MDALEESLRKALVVPEEYQRKIPPLLLESLVEYVVIGRPTGHFMYAVLVNDLFQAYAHADCGSVAAMPFIVKYIFNHLPGNCWGSPEEVGEWLKRGGQYGREVQRQREMEGSKA